MTNYNTIGNDLKRRILKFSDKFSIGLRKPEQKFVADMIYGIVASGDCLLTEIGRALKEDIALKKTVERLGRQLSNFSEPERDVLMKNYLTEAKQYMGDDTMILIDGSDVTKPCSPKMEDIGFVYDASKGKYAKGYWTMGAVALSQGSKQPIPVYESLYPCKKQGGMGSSAETVKCLQYLRENFDSSVPRVFDRGFDSGKTLQMLTEKDEKFILRVNQNRVVVCNGTRGYINDIVREISCERKLVFKSRAGNVSKCKIGMAQISLPHLKNINLNLVICKKPGEAPLMLYTNLSESIESLAERILKGYLMRWRIEEFYAFKKQVLQFEGFRVRGLTSIKSLDLLLTIAAGCIGFLCATPDEKITVELIAISKRITKTARFLKNTKFYYYAVFDGVKLALASLRCGISRLFSSGKRNNQLCIDGFEILG